MAIKKTGAQLLVECLEKQGVEYIFGIPGAKVDAVFNALADGGPRLILCRHEQNAAFMAGAVGRLTGRPGVVLVTSGPGVSNLTTGLATATTEGDPVVALGGAVPRNMRLKQTHQSMDNVSVMKAVTKSSVELVVPENIPEVVQNAFRTASAPRRGAAFISLPQDILNGPAEGEAPEPVPWSGEGEAPLKTIEEAARLLKQARQPVLLLGLEASQPNNTTAIRELLRKFPLATVGTYEAAGVVSRDLVKYFVGRVGLFRNQPGDRLLESADVVLAVGFDPVEYDPGVWNAERQLKIIHLDYNGAEIDRCYQPVLELIGDMGATVEALTSLLPSTTSLKEASFVSNLQAEFTKDLELGAHKKEFPIHPLRFIYDLRNYLDDETTVISDVGSHYMWLARHFFSYEPHHLLFSNGQQTLGVALPWAMATTLVRPGKKVVSISGDGGFLFSAMELETAVREKCSFVHCVWRDGAYDMVGSQEKMKYGREFGVRFGSVDLVAFAQSFGAKGFSLSSADEFLSVLEEALKTEGPVLIDVPIDYRDNDELFATTDSFRGH